jgi:hypothetical protein
MHIGAVFAEIDALGTVGVVDYKTLGPIPDAAVSTDAVAEDLTKFLIRYWICERGTWRW